LEAWEKSHLYHRIVEKRKSESAPQFTLHDGPPFANGDVHMGTALNKILKDLVLKSKTMSGHYTPYVPGWDCHGLPIEFKVVKESRSLNPLEIRKKSEELARKFIDIQRTSFRRLGVFGDWENPYLTLAPGYEADIVRTFATFIEKGLVYQSKKPVYWSYGAQTALAEAEVEYKDKTSPAIYVKFPIVEGPLAGDASLVIWTTTPWTLPANVGIALHPDFDYLIGNFRHEDGRSERLVIAEGRLEAFAEATGFQLEGEPSDKLKGSDLLGAAAKHPFLDRHSKVINGQLVTLDAGTGAVHIAPGHGQEDYIVGMEYGLEVLSPVDDDGKFTADCGVDGLAGQLVFDTNGPIIRLLAESGHLLGKESHFHSYPHCWRSKTPIIFRAVEQFFIKIEELRERALEEIDRVTWMPHWGRNRIHGTVEARPDWCISRQRTWGVPLPVFFAPSGESMIDPDVARQVADLFEEHGTNLWFEKDDAWWNKALNLPEGSTRCRDTLDVWIDSGCSHVAVLDRHPELATPCDLYLEATDQHRGWFQSSLLISTAVRDTAPYRNVLTHGFVVDVDKKKLSKSEAEKAGKPIDAAYFYGKYGADIVRLWCAGVDWEQEVPFGEELFKQTTETYRRFRNTLRILLGNINGFDFAKDRIAKADMPLLDRWILERLNKVVADCTAAYERYEFRKVFDTLNQFCAVDVSAIYVDLTKDRMYCDAPESQRRLATQTAMHQVFEALCKLLAPILVFTTDEAWEHSGHQPGDIHLERFPAPDPDFAGSEAIDRIAKLQEYRNVVQQEIERARQAKEIGSNNEASVVLTLPEESPVPLDLAESGENLLEYFMVSTLEVEAGTTISARISRSIHPKCPRCWRHLPLAPGKDVCARCAEVLSS
ncbi:MAG: isoleucine--tRNA ligase, partial [Verrucomicrobiota bacterium]